MRAISDSPNTNHQSHSAAKSTMGQGSTNKAKNFTVGQPNDAYEQEADRVADQVINGSGKSGDSGQKPGPKHIQAKSLLNAPTNQIQRFAFVGGMQVDKAAKQPNATMQAWTADNDIRDYKNMTEFEKHSAGGTEHIGVLKTGASLDTWLRFSDTGLNVLGESHNKVNMEHVANAVGTTSFTYEPFSTDDFSNLPITGSIYDQENARLQKSTGIDKATDKKKHGGESIFPKVTYALDKLMPQLDPALISGLESGNYPDGSPKYSGQPYQRYFRLGWAWSLDNQINIVSDPLSVTNSRLELANVHNDLATLIDPFFSNLKPEGFLGDVLAKPANAHLFDPLKKFGKALITAMYEMLSNDPDSPLPPDEKNKLHPSSTSTSNEKFEVIRELRDLNLLNSTIAASKAGMRYSGMGLNHLKYIQNNGHMKPGWHPYNMADKDLKKFEENTKKLKSKAK